MTQVTQFVKVYGGEEARDFANTSWYWILSPYSEFDLVHYLTSVFFEENKGSIPLMRIGDKIPLDQEALVRKTEYNSQSKS